MFSSKVSISKKVSIRSKKWYRWKSSWYRIEVEILVSPPHHYSKQIFCNNHNALRFLLNFYKVDQCVTVALWNVFHWKIPRVNTVYPWEGVTDEHFGNDGNFEIVAKCWSCVRVDQQWLRPICIRCGSTAEMAKSPPNKTKWSVVSFIDTVHNFVNRVWKCPHMWNRQQKVLKQIVDVDLVRVIKAGVISGGDKVPGGSLIASIRTVIWSWLDGILTVEFEFTVSWKLQLRLECG